MFHNAPPWSDISENFIISSGYIRGAKSAILLHIAPSNFLSKKITGVQTNRIERIKIINKASGSGVFVDNTKISVFGSASRPASVSYSLQLRERG